jgi:hypothetical protein
VHQVGYNKLIERFKSSWMVLHHFVFPDFEEMQCLQIQGAAVQEEQRCSNTGCIILV